MTKGKKISRKRILESKPLHSTFSEFSKRRALNFQFSHFLFFNLRMYGNDVETVPISEENVNPKDEKVGPESFELLKVLGKGGYGKVRIYMAFSWYLSSTIT